MHTLNKKVYFLAICLSALAGCVDAIGFLQLGGYFISFMSGNTTRLAVHVADGHFSAVGLVGGVLFLFVAGSMLGTLVRHWFRVPSPVVAVLLFVTLMLALAAGSHELGYGAAALVFMTMAMGAENAVLHRRGDVIGLTYMTGTLVKVGQRLAYALLGENKFSWVPYLLLWAGLVIGGIAGTLLYLSFGMHSLWFACGLCALLALFAFNMRGHTVEVH